MNKFELVVTDYEGREVDRQIFDSEEDAKTYLHQEWGGNDKVGGYSIASQGE